MRTFLNVRFLLCGIVQLYLFASHASIHAQSTTVEVALLPRIRIDSAYSPALQKMKRFVVMLPMNYDSTRRYPVLYLLHGWGGGSLDWSTKTRLHSYATTAQILIVMPRAENSWYVNSATNATIRYEDYIAQDLPIHVSTRFPAADTNRQAIAGLSMGGFGAVMLAFKYPQKYRLSGSFSGALTMPRDLGIREGLNRAAGRNNSDFILLSLLDAFGKAGNLARSENDIFTLLGRYANTDSATKARLPNRLPYFYITTGIQDPLRTIVSGNRELRDSLYSANIRYEYHESPGGHDWAYWDEAVRGFLPRLVELLGWK
jgi:putative tributyrin esterase